MDTEKIAKELERVDLPGRVPLFFKNTLRRQLLNSSYFTSTVRRTSAVKYIVSTAITAAATAMIILYVMTPSTFSSANELLAHVESVYANMAVNGQIHYLRTLFNSLSGRAPLEEEEWSYDHFRQFSVKTHNAATGEVIGHVIKTGGKMYSRPNKLQKFKFNLEEKSIPANHDAKTAQKEIKDLRVLLIPVREDPKIVQVYIFDDAWTPESFSKRTPLDIVQSLKSDSQVTYAGRETNAAGDSYEILEVHRSQDLYLFKVIVDQKLEHAISKLLAQIEKGEAVKPETIEVRESIKINSKTGTLYHISHSVRQNSREIERFDLTFLDEKYIQYDPGIFDPQRFGLKTMVPTE